MNRHTAYDKRTLTPVELFHSVAMAGPRRRLNADGIHDMRRCFHFIFLLVLATLSLGCQKEPAQPKASDKGKPADPLRVQLVEARADAMRAAIRVTGTLYPEEEVLVSAKVSGRVVAIHHDLGDRINPGAVLVSLDPVDFQLVEQEKQLAVSATLAKLGLSAFPEKEFEPTQVPTVKRAAKQLANVQAKFARVETLFQKTPPLVSEEEFADAKTAVEVARSVLEVEALNARALLAEARTRQAELEVARQNLKETTVYAPDPAAVKSVSAATATPVSLQANRAYAVAQRMVSEGEYVRESTPLFRLIDDNPVKLRAMVPELHIGQVAAKLSAKVTVHSYSDPFAGVVGRISPQIDAASRTFPVEILIANPDGKLKPGAFASASIELADARPTVIVPATAVASFAGVSKVFLVKDQKAVEARVELGDRSGEHVHILKGLAAGAKVIAAPPSRLVAGTPVVVEEVEEAKSPREKETK